VLDLLSIRDSYRISEPGREAISVSVSRSLPLQTIESILPLGDGRLLLLTITLSLERGPQPRPPDDTEAIIVRADALSPSPKEMPSTGGPPLSFLVGPVLMAVGGAVWVILQRRVRAVAVRRSP
jgi:hypothetical protein